jgi:hypothetical protein
LPELEVARATEKQARPRISGHELEREGGSRGRVLGDAGVVEPGAAVVFNVYPQRGRGCLVCRNVGQMVKWLA